MKFLGTALATILLGFSFVAPAEAFRPVPGHNYADLCKNIKGEQNIGDIIMRRYAYDTSTSRPNDCYRVTHRGR